MGATVGYTLDAIPAMDETSHILNLLAQGYCLARFDMNRIVSNRLDKMTVKTA